MKLFLPKYPTLLRLLYPRRLSILPSKNTLYLTFDDGPIPEATPWVLQQLKKYQAKATFFCIGENVKKHPELFQKILDEDHIIGNHTYNHLKGWKTPTSDYLDNTEKARQIFTRTTKEIPSNLFRPPYGRIKNSQAKHLQQQGYKIVMWDVLSGDYDAKLSPEQCLKNVIHNTSEGSIVVFHDSIKALRNLKVVLPEILEYYSKKGFEFRSLKDIL